MTPDPSSPASPPYLQQQGGVLLLRLKVVPNSRRTQLAGPLGDALKLKISQPPEDGRANKAVVAFLAEVLDLPAAAITIISGQTNPQKTAQLAGITFEQAAEKLHHQV
jgi:uncharacterized protein (TIGR00251 family)